MFSKCDRREETGFYRRLSVIRITPGRRATGRAALPPGIARNRKRRDSRWRIHQALLPVEEPPWPGVVVVEEGCGTEEIVDGDGDSAGDGDGGACGRGSGSGLVVVVGVGVGRGLWTRALALGAPITPRLSSE